MSVIQSTQAPKGWHGPTPTILPRKSKSTKSTKGRDHLHAVIQKEAELFCGSIPRRARCSPMLGSFKNLKQFKDSESSRSFAAIRKDKDFLRILSTAGRGVGLCWATSKANGPKDNIKVEPRGPPSHALLEDHSLAARREPSAPAGST